MAQEKFVAYYRVSTNKQNLGLDAQRATVQQHITSVSGNLIAEYQEKESGKRDDRPQIAKAIARAKRENATLVIAKLDRLARNAAFILSLRDSQVKFIACDIPEANCLTIGIFAVIAQMEREMISQRTKDALAALKAQGKQLGNLDNLTDAGRRKGAEVRRSQAIENNQQAAALAKVLHEQGKTLQAIANKLNAEGFVTAKGMEFKRTQVKRMLDRIK